MALDKLAISSYDSTIIKTIVLQRLVKSKKDGEKSMNNIWLEVDEPRKSFFGVAHTLIANIAILARNGDRSKLYSLYASMVKAYRKLDTIVKLYDRDVAVTIDGIDAALDMYCQGDRRFDEIFANC